MSFGAVVRDSTDEDIDRACKPRSITSRKGENGVVLVVGGSWLYHGAPLLTALAALRSGVDLVYVAVPEKVATPIRAYTPSLIVLPLPDMKLTSKGVSRIRAVLQDITAAAIGPGLARGSEKGLIRLIDLLIEGGVPLALDATALHPDILPKIRGRPCVLTPHAGEFRRVFGREAGNTLDERIKTVHEEAKNNGLVILLKGVVDVISDGSIVVLNKVGSPAMTVGGSGDVLCGLVAGLMARAASPLEAAIAAARVNGIAGERAAQLKGMHITPEDIINEIPNVLKPYDKLI
ncbi:MAG: NAD(P)H-hydrate dehydratase [Aigarchaeota archaeon]|nr:NAD(P)H-hydrate dehydratase [Candidatus Pelearchaeum maunauluense]